MSNRFQILLKSQDGIELDTWLRQKSIVFKGKSNLESLDNMRIFYIVKAAFEKDTNIYKIGISERGAHAAKSRLIDYTYYYGTADKVNPCKGVKIYLVLANHFNPDVNASDSYVRKLETRVKDEFKEARDRGNERINVPLEKLFKYLEETYDLFDGDTEKVTRKTPRLAEKQQGANEAVKKIVGIKSDRRGNNKKYEVEFMAGFKYDENENRKPYTRPNAILSYDEIVQLPRGKTLLDEFIKENEENTDTTAPTTTRTTRNGARVTNLGNTNNNTTNTNTNQAVSSRTRRGGARVTNL